MVKDFMKGVEIIRILRQETTREIVSRAGITTSTYTRLRYGTSKSTRTSTLIKLAKAIDMTVDEVLDFIHSVKGEVDKIENK